MLKLKKLNQFIFVINGSGGVGKDTLIHCVRSILKQYKYKISICEDNKNSSVEDYYSVWSYSSIDEIKEAAKMLGWNESSKTEKDRKFLADLKNLSSRYNDYPFQKMKEACNIFDFMNEKNPRILFLHIREPEEIQRVVNEFGAKTILVKRDSVEHITSNAADANVFNYKYDYVIENNGTIEDLKDAAERFLIEVGILEDKINAVENN